MEENRDRPGLLKGTRNKRPVVLGVVLQADSAFG